MIEEYAIFANRLVGGLTKSYGKRPSRTFRSSLEKAGIAVPPEFYLSLVFFVAGLVGLVSFLLITFMASFVSGSVIYGVAVGFAVAMLLAAIAGTFVLMYPRIASGKVRRLVDESLPYTLSFMSILSASGVSPKRIFQSLAKMEAKRQIGLGGEAKRIYRDMEFLGSNMVTSLKEAGERGVSPLFGTAVDGIISSIESGSDLTGYLRTESASLMRLRRGIVKEFLDSLVMISEMYMSLLVAFPLILIVMLIVMASIGGGNLGGVTPESIIPLISYVMVPAVGVVVIVWLDSAAPKG